VIQARETDEPTDRIGESVQVTDTSRCNNDALRR
jgi:hypothetical protein